MKHLQERKSRGDGSVFSCFSRGTTTEDHCYPDAASNASLRNYLPSLLFGIVVRCNMKSV
jgi:hypothetical protein